MTRLTHTDDSGRARMVDVSSKSESVRSAVATGAIRMSPSTLDAIRNNSLKKGDVLGVARIAGIMAAKKTSDTIPLCHPIALTDIQVEFTFDDSLPGVRVQTVARTIDQTGVETYATVFALQRSLPRRSHSSRFTTWQKRSTAECRSPR